MKRAATPVAAAAAELDQIATLAASDIEPQILERIRELIDVTSDRAEIDPTWCVIGMLGGTGAGKSSLVNALAGGEVVCAGVLRPTTNEACAVLPAGREPKELLGWLGVRTRVCAPGDLPGDTAIIDLPDIDSVEASHAQVAGRLAMRVDALVVVVNPQKYADARLHDEWLERLRTSHASVTVALTHIDTLGVAERTSIVSDLRRILDERGLTGARVVPVSATTGEGVAELASHLADEAARVSHQAARARAALSQAARLMRDAVGVESTIRGVETEGMASDLARVAADLVGAPIIAEAMAASTRRAGTRTGGWLPLRWLACLGVDPLRRLHLGEEERQESATTPTLPTRSASDEAAFVNAVRREVAVRSQGAPRALAPTARRARPVWRSRGARSGAPRGGEQPARERERAESLPHPRRLPAYCVDGQPRGRCVDRSCSPGACRAHRCRRPRHRPDPYTHGDSRLRPRGEPPVRGHESSTVFLGGVPPQTGGHGRCARHVPRRG